MGQGALVGGVTFVLPVVVSVRLFAALVVRIGILRAVARVPGVVNLDLVPRGRAA